MSIPQATPPKATADLFGEDFYLFADNATGTVNTNPSVSGDAGYGLSDGFDFKLPDFDLGFGGSDIDTKGKESGGGIGSTLQGIGAVTGALASIYGIREQKKYQDEVLGMEKERVAKNEARRDTKQAEYEKVWGSTDA